MMLNKASQDLRVYLAVPALPLQHPDSPHNNMYS